MFKGFKFFFSFFAACAFSKYLSTKWTKVRLQLGLEKLPRERGDKYWLGLFRRFFPRVDRYTHLLLMTTSEGTVFYHHTRLI